MRRLPGRNTLVASALALALAPPASGQVPGYVDPYAPATPVPYAPSAPLDAPGAPNLVAMADALAAQVARLDGVIANDLRGIGRDPFVARDLDALYRAVDGFRAEVRAGADPARLADAFAAIDADWHALADRLEALSASPDVLGEANRVVRLDRRLHDALGANPGAATRRVAYRPAYNPVAEAASLASGLAAESDQFVRRFVATTFKVPEGAGFIADTTRLRDVSAALAQDAQSGLGPAELAPRVAQLNGSWAALKSRLDRVAFGRPVGPNIAELLNMGNTIARINALLDPRAGAFGPAVGPLAPGAAVLPPAPAGTLPPPDFDR
jgi:hypothetical protein